MKVYAFVMLLGSLAAQNMEDMFQDKLDEIQIEDMLSDKLDEIYIEDRFKESLDQLEMEDKFGDALAEVEIENKLEANLIEDEMDARIRQILANDDLHEQKTQLLSEVDKIDLKIKQMNGQTNLANSTEPVEEGGSKGDDTQPKGVATWVWVVVAIVAILSGFAIWKFVNGSKTENEGGEDDRYTKFVDKTLST